MLGKGKILIVCSDPDLPEEYGRMLGPLGYEYLSTPNPSEVHGLVVQHRPDLVVGDLGFKHKDSIRLLRELRKSSRRTPLILVGTQDTLPPIQQALREGASDCLPRPFSAQQLSKALRTAMSTGQAAAQDDAFDGIVGKSPLMLEIFETIKKIATADVDVLIYGESGTGKELVARSLHKRSRRESGPFVPVDCASIPEHLLESELFGHDRGAFTGAYATRPGIFEFANHGTLFLDEVSRLRVSLQAKLLRALQERQIRRLGGRQLIPIDVRVISATNADLKEAIARDEFREDLYYRLNVVVISLPPLRDRHQDISLLAQHYLRYYNQRIGRNVKSISEEAVEQLNAYSWPGNVRELMNLIKRAVLLAEGDTILTRELPPSLLSEPHRTFRPDLPYAQAKRIWTEAFQERYIEGLLKRFDGNLSRAAQEAGIDRKTIQRFLSKRKR